MFKAVKKTCLVVLCGLSFQSAADMIGASLEADVWRSKPEGKTPTQTTKFDNANEYSVRVSVDHPIPVLPNAQLRFKHLELNKEDENIEDKHANITDIIAYYRLLDNDLVALKFGVSYEQANGKMQMTKNASEIDLSTHNIMGYLYGDAKVVGTGLFVFADILKGLQQTKDYDYQVGLGYEFNSFVAMKLGYQHSYLKRDEKDEPEYSIENAGYFVGIHLSI